MPLIISSSIFFTIFCIEIYYFIKNNILYNSTNKYIYYSIKDTAWVITLISSIFGLPMVIASIIIVISKAVYEDGQYIINPTLTPYYIGFLIFSLLITFIKTSSFIYKQHISSKNQYNLLIARIDELHSKMENLNNEKLLSAEELLSMKTIEESLRKEAKNILLKEYIELAKDIEKDVSTNDNSIQRELDELMALKILNKKEG